jgi:hypothetical protein
LAAEAWPQQDVLVGAVDENTFQFVAGNPPRTRSIFGVAVFY